MAIQFVYEEFYGDCPRGTPPSGSLKTTEVAKFAILDQTKAIYRKRRKIGGKLVLNRNKKSCMRFRLVPKSLTLNDLERRNGPYFTLFQRNR